jgi:hypothetical protein
MATTFQKGQNVKAVSVIPEGPVQALRMDEDGKFFYLISWTDLANQEQQRWFEESELVAA